MILFDPKSSPLEKGQKYIKHIKTAFKIEHKAVAGIEGKLEQTVS